MTQGCEIVDSSKDDRVRYGMIRKIHSANAIAESTKMSNLPPAPTSLLIAFLIIQHLCEVSHVVSELSSS